MSSVVIRPARAGDKDAVLAFTIHTWDWGDYLTYVWDEWLAAPDGELAVAEIDGTVVGVVMTTRLTAHEGWLQGLRVHPDYQRQGIAAQFTTYQLDLLRRWGVSVVRLAVYSHNQASQALVARTGFQRVTTAAMLKQAVVAAAEAPLLVTLAPGEIEAAWRLIEQSATLPAAGGLWERDWAWRALTPETVAELAAQGLVLGIRAGAGTWGALALAWRDEESLHVGYVDGSGSALGDLAAGLLALAKQQGAADCLVAVPPQPALLAAFRQAGFSNEDESDAMFIYEMRL